MQRSKQVSYPPDTAKSGDVDPPWPRLCPASCCHPDAAKAETHVGAKRSIGCVAKCFLFAYKVSGNRPELSEPSGDPERQVYLWPTFCYCIKYLSYNLCKAKVDWAYGLGASVHGRWLHHCGLQCSRIMVAGVRGGGDCSERQHLCQHRPQTQNLSHSLCWENDKSLHGTPEEECRGFEQIISFPHLDRLIWKMERINVLPL